VLKIYIDADACPVKEETFRVARRYGLRVILVANSWMRLPSASWLTLKLVGDGLDAADDWIVGHLDADDIVITADIPLASRSLARGAAVLSPTGRSYTEENIGEALATRDLLARLREAGAQLGGPPPYRRQDASRFLQGLDALVQALRRKNRLP